MILLQPGSGTAYATRVSVVSALPCPSPPATSLDPPPHAASMVAVRARAAAGSQRDFLMVDIDDLSLRTDGREIRHDGKELGSGLRNSRSHHRLRTADGHGIS